MPAYKHKPVNVSAEAAPYFLFLFFILPYLGASIQAKTSQRERRGSPSTLPRPNRIGPRAHSQRGHDAVLHQHISRHSAAALHCHLWHRLLCATVEPVSKGECDALGSKFWKSHLYIDFVHEMYQGTEFSELCAGIFTRCIVKETCYRRERDLLWLFRTLCRHFHAMHRLGASIWQMLVWGGGQEWGGDVGWTCDYHNSCARAVLGGERAGEYPQQALARRESSTAGT